MTKSINQSLYLRQDGIKTIYTSSMQLVSIFQHHLQAALLGTMATVKG